MKIVPFCNEENWSNPRHCEFCHKQLSYDYDGTAFAVLCNDQANDGNGAHMWVCIGCLKELRMKIDALNILVRTGIDTK